VACPYNDDVGRDRYHIHTSTNLAEDNEYEKAGDL